MRVNVMMERTKSNLGNQINPVNSYSVLHPGSSRIQLVFRNLTSRTMNLGSNIKIAQMYVANMVPNMLAS